MIDHIDYPDQDFTRLRYSNALTLIIWKNQSHLDLHTNFTSTWLYPVVFRHCIRNIDSPTSKYSELLADHCGDLKSDRHLYLYPSWAALDSRAFHRWVAIRWWCTSIFYLYAISISSYSLVKKITNPYSIQWFILDKRYCPC